MKMKKLIAFAFICLAMLVSPSCVRWTDLTGVWKSEDSSIILYLDDFHRNPTNQNTFIGYVAFDGVFNKAVVSYNVRDHVILKIYIFEIETVHFSKERGDLQDENTFL